MLTNLQLDKTFKRIGLSYDPSKKISDELMARIQYAFQKTVPYENLDVVRGIPISLQPEDLYRKIVEDHRGGYCFEINGLLSEVYQSLGYQVTDCFGRYLRGETTIPMRRHRVLIVNCPDTPEKRYACDAGVGQSAYRLPLLLQEGFVSQQYGETYYVDKDPFFGWVISDLHKGEKRVFYGFTEEPQLIVDFDVASFWCQKSPDSPFTSSHSFAIKNDTGRKTLDGDKFRVFDGDNVTEITVSEDEKVKIATDVFGIRM